jgi:sialic acid synthase
MSQRMLTIEGVEISDETDCFVIAEIGHNHQGDIETVKKLVDAAKLAGATAVKTQKRSTKGFLPSRHTIRHMTMTAALGPVMRA